jgi:tetrahydromethanopterin S-methyltransferase subunit G
MDNQITIQEFKAMDARLTEMEEKIDSIDTKVTQVVDAFLGNPLTKNGGFVGELAETKKRLEILEKKQLEDDNFKSKVLWTISIIASLLLFSQYVLNIYSKMKGS